MVKNMVKNIKTNEQNGSKIPFLSVFIDFTAKINLYFFKNKQK